MLTTTNNETVYEVTVWYSEEGEVDSTTVEFTSFEDARDFLARAKTAYVNFIKCTLVMVRRTELDVDSILHEN